MNGMQLFQRNFSATISKLKEDEEHRILESISIGFNGGFLDESVVSPGLFGLYSEEWDDAFCDSDKITAWKHALKMDYDMTPKKTVRDKFEELLDGLDDEETGLLIRYVEDLEQERHEELTELQRLRAKYNV